MAHTVFISYASKDKAVADAACAALEAQRIKCWIAPRDILPGLEYGESIIDALTNCKIVLLIFSEWANESPQVRREVERAVSKGKIIITFRIKDVLPHAAMEYALSACHWLDALTPPLERRLVEICDTVGRLMERLPQDPLWDSRFADSGQKGGSPGTPGRVQEEPVSHATQPNPASDQTAAPNQVRTCPQCGKEAAAKNLHCPVDGARLGPPHAPWTGPKPVAQIQIVARPRVSMGSLNKFDSNSIGVEINASTFEMSWGQRVFQVQPGPVTVRVGIKTPMFQKLRCPGALTLDLKPGDVCCLRYTAAFTMFQDGTLVEDKPAVPVASYAPPSPGIRQCVSCKRSIGTSNVFCPHCGSKQS